MGFLLVLKAEIVRSFIIMRRYWFATLTGLVVGYGVLLLLVVGLMTNREEISDTLGSRFAGVDPQQATNAALGLIIGMFAFGIVGVFSQGLQGMARTGQLEQLCLSPHGLVTNFLGRSLVGAVSSIFTSGIILILIAHTVQGTLHLSPLPVFVLLVLTYVNLIGFGFMVGGLVLVFKQTGQVAVILRLVLLLLAIWATDTVDTGYKIMDALIHVLPITDAAICIKHVLIRDQIVLVVFDDGRPPIEEFRSVFRTTSFYFLMLSCVAWTAIGITLFRFMENLSRDKGTLGTY